MRKVEDIQGREIKVGDLVYRAKFSAFVVHEVLKINKRSLTLSCKRRDRAYRWEISLVEDSKNVEDIQNHNGTLFYPFPWSSRKNGSILLSGVLKIKD